MAINTCDASHSQKFASTCSNTTNQYYVIDFQCESSGVHTFRLHTHSYPFVPHAQHVKPPRVSFGDIDWELHFLPCTYTIQCIGMHMTCHTRSWHMYMHITLNASIPTCRQDITINISTHRHISLMRERKQAASGRKWLDDTRSLEASPKWIVKQADHSSTRTTAERTFTTRKTRHSKCCQKSH